MTLLWVLPNLRSVYLLGDVSEINLKQLHVTERGVVLFVENGVILMVTTLKKDEIECP
jgi:hypothetical protein